MYEDENVKTKSDKPKYVYPQSIDLPDRQWPTRVIEKSPQWSSVDLRDGNQALPNPLNPDQKRRYFKMLCDIGIKHIEVAFPSASKDDFDFTRALIEENLIPDDVFIMVLTQCRTHLVERTFESVKGIERFIFHAYCATSNLHMRQVFDISKKETIEMVVASIRQAREMADSMPETDMRLEFSPEEFTDTDQDFALELCEAVFETWGKATVEKPVILNLPATVERRPPNQHADMIEWFCRNFSQRDKVCVSLHAHNDQGMAVAATEMGLLAGADRVEGALFGHGERTGNVDLVVVANNLAARGIDTGLDFSDLGEVARTVETLTGMPIYYRQPYAGKYVFTAFSGSHQDAINKGMRKLDEAPDKFGVGWRVPYLHVDPADLGRKYERLICINSQSGKGGIDWVLEQEYSLNLPKSMLPEVGQAAQDFIDRMGREVSGEEIYKVFEDEFINPDGPFRLIGYWPSPDEENPTLIHGRIEIEVDGEAQEIFADGNGPISAFVNGIRKVGIFDFTVDDFHEQAVGKTAHAKAMAYVPLKTGDNEIFFGVGADTNIDQAAVKAIVAGLNRIARALEMRREAG